MRTLRTLRTLLLVVTTSLGMLPASAGEKEVRIETVPPSAKVEQAGRVLGHTPLTLKYPSGYFQTRATVWGAYLGAPLEFTFTLPGYESKMVKLGRGPFPSRNLYGAILYEYYLLDHSYRIELLPEKAESVVLPVDQVSQLERLAALRAQGVLTEEEFQTAKARVLAAPPATVVATAPGAGKPKNHLEDQDPTRWRFAGASLRAPFPGRKPRRQERRRAK